MAGYRFLTTWLIEAPRERVWDVLADSPRWPEWWRGVVAVDVLRPGEGEDRIGELARYTWRSRLPYELAFDMEVVRVQRPVFMEGHASGELAGIGRWRLFEEGGVTAVVYQWDVQTTRPWMNTLAPLLRPAFAWNHDWVMRQGGEGLARRVAAPPQTTQTSRNPRYKG
jgi:uncharacterized protein YndB with AHSA1/START domain